MAGRRAYPDEFRARAVRTVFEREGEHPSRSSAIASVAAEFGVSREALRRWVRQSEVDGVPVPVYDTGEEEPSSPDPERPALRLVRQERPAPDQPLTHRGSSDESGDDPDALARRRRLRPAEPVEIDETTSDAQPTERVTRVVSWSELEQAADDATDLDAIVRTELERLGEPRLPEPIRRKPSRHPRRTRWIFVVITAVATAAAAAVIFPRVGDLDEPAAPPSNPVTPSVAPSSTPSPTKTAPPAEDAIVARLTISAPCWVEVMADERSLFRGTLADATRAFRADRSLILTLGNAGAARLTVNGRSIETGSAGEVVHFSFALKQGTVVER
jgi:transposase-like protein